MKTVNTNRRDLLAGGGLALLGAGFLSRVDKVAAQQRPLSLTEQVKKQAGGPSEKLFVNAAVVTGVSMLVVSLIFCSSRLAPR